MIPSARIRGELVRFDAAKEASKRSVLIAEMRGRVEAGLREDRERAERKERKAQQRARKDAATGVLVYFIVDEQRQVVKIGMSQNPENRLKELQTGNPHPLTLAAIVPGGYVLERQLHERFAAHRLSGEWFQLTREIRGQIESLKAQTAE